MFGDKEFMDLLKIMVFASGGLEGFKIIYELFIKTFNDDQVKIDKILKYSKPFYYIFPVIIGILMTVFITPEKSVSEFFQYSLLFVGGMVSIYVFFLKHIIRAVKNKLNKIKGA